jgi:hypothetical protein
MTLFLPTIVASNVSGSKGNQQLLPHTLLLILIASSLFLLAAEISICIVITGHKNIKDSYDFRRTLDNP